MDEPDEKKWGVKKMSITTRLIIVVLLLGAKIDTVFPDEIFRISLDKISDIGTTIELDSRTKVEGDGSIKVSTKWPTTINLREVKDLDIDNTTLVYQAKVKSEGLKGTAYLEMWCFVGGGQYFSRGMDSAVTGSMDWETLSTPFLLQAGQKADRVILNVVINGHGTIWIDDIQLTKGPLLNQ